MHSFSRQRKLQVAAAAGLVVSGALVAQSTRHTAPQARTSAAARKQLSATMARLPLSFEINEGQADGQVKFLAGARGQRLYLTQDGAVLSLSRTHRPDRLHRKSRTTVQDTAQVRMRLAGSNPQAKVEGLDLLPGRVNYLKGRDKSQWRTNVKTYGKVRYAGVYPGVDVVYYGNQSQLEYDVVVKPGQNPGVVKLSFNDLQERPTAAEVAKDGSLLLHTGTGDLLQHRPVVYQNVAGKRQPIEGRYVQLAKNEIGFSVGSYDHAQPLVIDPVVAFSTYLGGTGDDEADGIAVDGSGNIYVAGSTFSDPFKTQGSLPGHDHLLGEKDAFVTKLSADGTALVYSTYVGGSGEDEGHALTLDSANRVWATGLTNSPDFPGSGTGPFGNNDAFVFCLNATGSALDFVYELGGAGDDSGESIARDAGGNTYVAGSTGGINGATPIGTPASGDGFVAKFNANLTLGFLDEIGGSNDEGIAGVAVGNGNVYVTGSTDSANFPVLHGVQSALGNDPGVFVSDAFLTVLNSTDGTLTASTYLGGLGEDRGAAVAVDDAGAIYLAGLSSSPNLRFDQSPFATVGKQAGVVPGDGGPGSTVDAFLAKYTLDGTGLHAAFGTFLGDGGDDAATAVVVDNAGVAYLTGSSNSPKFPLVNAIDNKITGIDDPDNGLPTDVFVAKVDTTKTGDASLLFATFLGGSGEDEGRGIAFDASGNIYVAGVTESKDFPNESGLYPSISGVPDEDNVYPDDAFILKLTNGVAPAALKASLSGTNATLTWSYNGPVAKFNVYRSVNGGAFNLVAGNFAKSPYSDDLASLQRATDQSIAYQVTAQQRDSESGPSNSSSVTLLGPPTSLQITQGLDGNNQPTKIFNVSFVDNCGIETGFKLQRKSGNSFVDEATINPNPGTGTVTFAYDSSRDTGIVDGVANTYQVVAVCTTTDNVTTSKPSGAKSFTRQTGAPNAPSGLTASLSGTTVTLKWMDNATDNTGFKVEQSTDGVSFSQATTNPTTLTGTSSSCTVSVASLLGASDVTLTYRVKSVKSNAPDSDPSNTDTVMLLGQPNALALNQVLDVNGLPTKTIGVQFNDNSNGETAYRLQRLSGTKWLTVATIPAQTGTAPVYFSYDSSVTPPGVPAMVDGTSYTFQLIAASTTVDNVTTSMAAGPVSFVRKAVPPAAPTNLSFSLINGTLMLSWADNSDNEDGFLIYSSTDGTTFNVAAPVKSSGAVVKGTGTRTASLSLSAEQTWSLKVASYRGTGAAQAVSMPTNTVAVTIPRGPSGLSLVAAAGKKVTVTFTDNSAIETGFEVLRTVGKTQVLVATLAAHSGTGGVSTQITDLGATANASATYTVRAITASGSSTPTSKSVKVLP